MASELIRAAVPADLAGVLLLYQHLIENDTPLAAAAELEVRWQELLGSPLINVLVTEFEQRLVATCVLVVVPNLTRSARPFALIENVVTHAGFRNRGIGKRIMQHAMQQAWQQDCYKIMLLTGRREPQVHRFYTELGFRADAKTGYVARPPATA